MNDLISRQAAIDEMKTRRDAAKKWYDDAEDDNIRSRADSAMASFIECVLTLKKLPSAQPEEAIPISWFEEEIEKCRMVGDRTFSSAAVIMHVMLNEWRREQHE